MLPSPCYKCPDNPCKNHDTCPKFIAFRQAKSEEKRKMDEFRAAVDATCLAVRRCKRKR